jgi:hypothetical protein
MRRVMPRVRPKPKKRGLSIVDAIADRNLFEPWFRGPSWNAWRTIVKAAYALEMSEAERAFFTTIANREPPRKRVKELWVCAGRRAGKDSIASVIAAHTAALFDPKAHKLRPGERPLVMCLAVDRDQAKIVLNYTKAFFDKIPMLRKQVQRETKNGLELTNTVDIAVATNTYRAVRGRPVLAVILDEVAFWRDEDSATPDEETYKAVKPGMVTLPDSLLIGISTPYRRTGLLFRKWKEHYGQDSDETLVVLAPSLVLNPTLDQSIIDKAIAEDPAAANAEWNAVWRSDIETFVDPDTIDNVIMPGQKELVPVPGIAYHAFVDPAGGSGGDSMTLAITHKDRDGYVIVDAVREKRPSFSPDNVVSEFVQLLKSYRIRAIRGDRFAGEWCREPFRKSVIAYELSEYTKSQIYQAVLPILNSGTCELLDLPRLINQLCGLERRTARGGRESIDHAPGAHDDVANAVAGAILLASGKSKQIIVSQATREWAKTPDVRHGRARGSRTRTAINPNGTGFHSATAFSRAGQLSTNLDFLAQRHHAAAKKG